MKTEFHQSKLVPSILAAAALTILGSASAHAQYVDLVNDDFTNPQAPNPAEFTFSPQDIYGTSTLTDSSLTIGKYTGLTTQTGDGSTWGLEEESNIGANGGPGLSIFTTSAQNENFGGTQTNGIALDATPGQVTGTEIQSLEFLMNYSLTNASGFYVFINPTDANGNQLNGSQNIQFYWGANAGNSNGTFSLADFNLSGADYQTFADQLNAADSIYFNIQVIDTFNRNGDPGSINLSNLEVRQYGVPEPSTWALLALSAGALFLLARRRVVLS